MEPELESIDAVREQWEAAIWAADWRQYLHLEKAVAPRIPLALLTAVQRHWADERHGGVRDGLLDCAVDVSLLGELARRETVRAGSTTAAERALRWVSAVVRALLSALEEERTDDPGEVPTSQPWTQRHRVTTTRTRAFWLLCRCAARLALRCDCGQTVGELMLRAARWGTQLAAHLLPVHVDALLLCVAVGEYAAAEEQLLQPLQPLWIGPPRLSWLSAADVMEFLQTGAEAYMLMGAYWEAFRLLHLLLTAVPVVELSPSAGDDIDTATSLDGDAFALARDVADASTDAPHARLAATIAAYKRYLCVALIATGRRQPSVRPGQHSLLTSITQHAREHHTLAYGALGRQFEKALQAISMREYDAATTGPAAAVFAADGTEALVQAVRQALLRFLVLSLGEVYTALPLEEIAQRVGASTADVREALRQLSDAVRMAHCMAEPRTRLAASRVRYIVGEDVVLFIDEDRGDAPTQRAVSKPESIDAGVGLSAAAMKQLRRGHSLHLCMAELQCQMAPGSARAAEPPSASRS